MITLIVPTIGTRESELKRLVDSLNMQSYKSFEVIIVSQDNHQVVKNIMEHAEFEYIQIQSDLKGLSVARNKALEYVRGDILTFSDDDCWYEKDSLEFVEKYFTEEKAEIAVFQHFDPGTEKFPKKYPIKPEKNVSRIKLLRQSSIDIFININLVKDYNIGFDNNFGVGAKYNSGEENIYLNDLKNIGYKIDYFPRVVSYHPHKFQSDMKLNNWSVISKSPLFQRFFGSFSGIFVYCIFLIRKRKNIDKVFYCFVKGLGEYVFYRFKTQHWKRQK